MSSSPTQASSPGGRGREDPELGSAQGTSVLERCASFAAAVRSGAVSVPPGPKRVAMESFVDTVAVMYSGLSEPVASITAEHARAMSAGNAGAALCAGGRADPAWAAFANASVAHAQDFDDHCPAVLGGHASAILVPVALAVGEQAGSSGPDLLDAYVVGFEVMAALARGVNPWHYAAGFHPTSTLGTFGAAVTASYLLGLGERETVHALAMSASFASGLKVNFGTMVKPLHCGWASLAGINAALLAGRGLEGNAFAYEGKQGFGEVHGGWRLGDQERPKDVRLGGEWFLETSGMPLRKPWPCCGSIHSSIEAALRIRNELGVAATELASVRVGVHPRRLPHTDRADPTSPAEARFSNQYCVATALLRGELSQKDFAQEALDDVDVRRVMQLVDLREDTRFEARDPAMSSASDFGAVVEVRTRSGEVYAEEVPKPLGGAGRPLPDGHVDQKFMNCASGELGTEAAAAFLDRLRSLEGASNVSGLWPQ